jgi:membrane protein
MGIVAFFGMLGEAGQEWMADRAPRLGAALAYYITFSLAPLMVLAIAVAGFVYGEDAARGEVLKQVGTLIGEDAGKLLQTMLVNVSQPTASWWATTVSIAVLLVGATGLFAELQDQLNNIWKVEPDPNRYVITFIRDRLMSFAMILLIGVLLMASLVGSTIAYAIVENFANRQLAFLSQTLNLAVSFLIILFLFGLIYRALPDTKVAWADVWLGAVVASILFMVGKYLLSLYIVYGAIASPYGAAGSLAVLLTWFYYASQIFLYGAELTKVYARRRRAVKAASPAA